MTFMKPKFTHMVVIKDQRKLLFKIYIVIIVLVKILKMKCTLFVPVNYIKIYVPNLKKKFSDLAPEKKFVMLLSCYGGDF